MTVVEALRDLRRKIYNNTHKSFTLAAVEEVLPLAEAQERRIAELEAALRFLRIQACQFGDFQYRAVSECSQEMIRGIDAALHPTPEEAAPAS